MNKLSSCKIFEMVDKTFKGSILGTMVEIASTIDKYIVNIDLYEYMVKSMRTYKYPLSKLIVKSALLGEIKPIILNEPKDKTDKVHYFPSAIPTLCTSDLKTGYVNISPRASYVRDERGNIESLKMKEIDLYAYLNMAFNEVYLKRYADIIDKSAVINKNIAICYSRLLTKAINKTFPIGANIEKYNVSIFLTSVFCLVKFFNYTVDDAKDIIFSSGICNKAEIETECKLLKEDKLYFSDIIEFLKLYNLEFDEYIPKESLTLRLVVNLFQKMYGANSWFAIEHAGSFFNMCLSTNIGLYNDKLILTTIKQQVDKVNGALVNIFSMKR